MPNSPCQATSNTIAPRAQAPKADTGLGIVSDCGRPFHRVRQQRTSKVAAETEPNTSMGGKNLILVWPVNPKAIGESESERRKLRRSEIAGTNFTCP